MTEDKPKTIFYFDEDNLKKITQGYFEVVKMVCIVFTNIKGKLIMNRKYSLNINDNYLCIMIH